MGEHLKKIAVWLKLDTFFDYTDRLSRRISRRITGHSFWNHAGSDHIPPEMKTWYADDREDQQSFISKRSASRFGLRYVLTRSLVHTKRSCQYWTTRSMPAASRIHIKIKTMLNQKRRLKPTLSILHGHVCIEQRQNRSFQALPLLPKAHHPARARIHSALKDHSDHQEPSQISVYLLPALLESILVLPDLSGPTPTSAKDLNHSVQNQIRVVDLSDQIMFNHLVEARHRLVGPVARIDRLSLQGNTQMPINHLSHLVDRNLVH